MDTDKELLEWAAKAAELKEWGWMGGSIGHVVSNTWAFFDSLTDNGDALALAAKLHMTVRCYMGTTVAQIGVPGMPNAYEEATNRADPAAANRRAITMAAAQIGRVMG